MTTIYQVTDTAARLRFELELGSTGQKTKNKLASSFLFVIDRSGSMAGVGMTQVQKSMNYIVDSCMANGQMNAHFIQYDSKAERITAEQAKNITSGGMTSFVAAFEAIRKFITTEAKNMSGSMLYVVFMTDGHDTVSNVSQIDEELKKFTFFVNTHCKKVQDSASVAGFSGVVVHTLGFGSNHATAFLDKLRTVGTVDGAYRFAEGTTGLEERFNEMFDFMSTTGNVKLSLDGVKWLPVEFEKDEVVLDEESGITKTVYKIDTFFDVATIGESTHSSLVGGAELPVYVLLPGAKEDKANAIVTVCQPAKTDDFFHLRELESLTISSKDELDQMQRELSAINPMSFHKDVRRDAMLLRMAVQEKLDQYHALFSEVARGSIPDGAFTARLQSLRYETKFAKARRKRTMDRRAANNVDRMLEIDDKLSALDIDIDAIAADADIAALMCPLTGCNVPEVLRNNNADVMVFPLRVQRSEFNVDAPSEIRVLDILNGTYSYNAINDALAHALTKKRAEAVHGGFSAVSEDVGLFRGVDGKHMNAVLPLYLHKEHWRRVQVEIEPILGFFFTLDPLGFKGDQYLALFAVLGQMLVLRATGEFASDYHAWLVQDMTRVCGALRTRALRYLKAGLYAGGKLTEDPLDEFVRTPAMRSREVIPNLMMLLGWYHVRNVEGNLTPETQTRFVYAFLEEAIRRCFGKVFHIASSVQFDDWEARLLYGASFDKVSPSSGTADGTEEVTHVDDKTEKQFAAYCNLKHGQLSKKNADTATRFFATNGPPQFEKADLPNVEQMKKLVVVSDAVAEEAVTNLMALIHDDMKRLTCLFDPATALKGHPHYDAQHFVDLHTYRYMCIQALGHCKNDKMNEAVASGRYKNIFDAEANGALNEVTEFLESEFQRRVNEKTDEMLKKREALHIATCIARSRNIHSFCGRVMVACPTRGGLVHENLVTILATGVVDGKTIPLLAEKIGIMLTGKAKLGSGEDAESFPIIANGQGWVHCDLDTASKFRDVVGDDVFTDIEIKMHGRSGWVYRTSDLPNRHSYCNSHPNPSLVVEFSGFKFSK